MTAAMDGQLARDVLRHEFTERELRVLFFILLKAGDGIEVVMERWEFSQALGLRTDHVLGALRALQRSRVLKPGWEDGRFVIEPNAELWKRDVLAPAICLAQRPLGMESGDDGVRFEHELARANLATRGAGELPARAGAEMDNCDRPGELPGGQVVQFPKSGSVFPKLGKPMVDAASPQFGEAATGGPPDAGLAALPKLGIQRNVERLSVSTFERLNVNVGELQERIRKFVGDDDFARHWARAGYLWRDPERLRVMEGSVAYLLAGVRSGEVTVQTNNGRALWSQVKRDWEAHQRERVGA